MLDSKAIEENPKILEKTLEARGMKAEIKNVSLFLEKRKKFRKEKKQLDELRHARNILSLEINNLVKQNKKEEAKKKKEEAKKIAEEIRKKEKEVAKIEEEIIGLELLFPNIISDLPQKEKIILKWGRPKKQRLNYIEICKNLGLLDFNSAVRMSGEGFCTFTNVGARLQRALINFFLDCARKNGYIEQFPPVLVNEKAMINSGQLPRFREGMYKVNNKTNNLYLVPTSEVSLLNLYAGKVLKKEELPIYVTAYSPCFRVEKGATKALFRMHQFDKVELFKFCKQEESMEELEKMVKDASQILRLLKIPHRIKLLPANEIGMASAKTYDIEAYAPASDEWLEVSSCSNCTDYQARRANIFYLDNGKKKLVHTLNGSGLAVPRTFIALVENYQQKDGLKIPVVLQKYVGLKIIK